MALEIDYLGEGPTDDTIAIQLIRFCGGSPHTSYARPARGRGKNSVDAKLAGLNAGSRFGRPCLVLRDLDRDAPCPGTLVCRLLPGRNPGLLLRICVPTADAWLVADTAAYARYCGIRATHLPKIMDGPGQSKQQLITILEQHAAKFRAHIGDTRKRKLPDWASFGQWQNEFAADHWDVARALASGRAPSLQRAERALRRLTQAAP